MTSLTDRSPITFFVVAFMCLTTLAASTAFAQQDATLVDIDRTMENYRLDAHIPGMVWAIVQDGRLIHVKAAGVQDLETKRPAVTALKSQVGGCNTATAISPTGALSGEFTWTCEHGRVRGQVLLAPTPTPRIQSLTLTRATP